MIKHLASLALAMAVVAGAGCGGSQKSGGGAAASKQSCATAAANAGAQLRKVAAEAPGGSDAAQMEGPAATLERVMTERCTADAWSAAAIDCANSIICGTYCVAIDHCAGSRMFSARTSAQ